MSDGGCGVLRVNLYACYSHLIVRVFDRIKISKEISCPSRKIVSINFRLVFFFVSNLKCVFNSLSENSKKVIDTFFDPLPSMDDRSDFTVSIEVDVSDTDDNLHTDMKPPQMNSNERPDVEMPPELEIKESQVNLISKLMHVHLTGIVKLL